MPSALGYALFVRQGQVSHFSHYAHTKTLHLTTKPLWHNHSRELETVTTKVKKQVASQPLIYLIPDAGPEVEYDATTLRKAYVLPVCTPHSPLCLPKKQGWPFVLVYFQMVSSIHHFQSMLHIRT
jgi:hypothetical protein